MVGCFLAILGWIGVPAELPCAAQCLHWLQHCDVSDHLGEHLDELCGPEDRPDVRLHYCKVYDSLLALSPDLQGARALVVVSIISGITGLFLAFAGGKCTNFNEEKRMKARVSGVMLISG